jgi:hypothetical protein
MSYSCWLGYSTQTTIRFHWKHKHFLGQRLVSTWRTYAKSSNKANRGHGSIWPSLRLVQRLQGCWTYAAGQHFFETLKSNVIPDSWELLIESWEADIDAAAPGRHSTRLRAGLVRQRSMWMCMYGFSACFLISPVPFLHHFDVEILNLAPGSRMHVIFWIRSALCTGC